MWEDTTETNQPNPYNYDGDTLPAERPDLSTVENNRPGTPPPPRRNKPTLGRTVGKALGCLQTIASIAAISIAAMAAVVIIGLVVVYNSLSSELEEDLDRLATLEGVENFETTRIYDRDGNLLYEVFDQGRRDEVPLSGISVNLQSATIATEDDTFYENPGFDPESIARAALEWYREGEIVSGGSTITQQLVRNIVFDFDERSEQTLRRKLKEAALAWVMTQQYSKGEILELYLNVTYYGNLAYGIGGAADVYFDKSAAELTLAESSFLAGLPQSPANWDPYTNFELAKNRQRQVLDLMVRHGYLTQAQSDLAFAEAPISTADLADPEIPLVAPHFTVEVRRQLVEETGIDPSILALGGLEVYTTIDLEYQALAEEVAQAQIEEFGEEFAMNNAALVAIKPTTGEVLAMLGSVDYEDQSIDGNVNVLLSPQQPGSTMKALTYAAAMEQGWTAADIIWDVPMAYEIEGADEPYEPVNYDLRFHGPQRLRAALANSYNIPAVTLMREVGIAELLDFSQRVGIESLGDDPLQYGLSLTLGGGELTPLEMTASYGVFATGGYYIEPHLISRVVDPMGEVIYQAQTTAEEPVLDPRIAFIISDILSDNDARTPAMGPASPLLTSFPSAAKTGTTNDFRDNWTIGYTPHLLVGVWTGNTDNSPMADGVSGLTGAAPIWNAYMEAVYANNSLTTLLQEPNTPALRDWYSPPADMEERPICRLSSLTDPTPAEEGCSSTQNEWFRILTEEDLAALDDTEVTETPRPTPTFPPLEPDDDDDGDIQREPAQQVELEPGIFVLSVLPLDDEARAAVSEILQIDNSENDDALVLPPRYCEVTQAYEPGAVQNQIFIAAPERIDDAIRARNWAVENGVPIVPGFPCNSELEELAALFEFDDEQSDFDEETGSTYRIDYPEPGQGVYGTIPILGTAAFGGDIQFYKVELGIGAQPEEWLTIGETHSESVRDGELETLFSGGLAPGPYWLRLALVGSDGNFVDPYDVPFVVLSEPPPPTPTFPPESSDPQTP